jgi:hypothetical protein
MFLLHVSCSNQFWHLQTSYNSRHWSYKLFLIRHSEVITFLILKHRTDHVTSRTVELIDIAWTAPFDSVMEIDSPSEEFYLLGCDAVKSVESQPTFRWNISPLSSESKKNKPSKIPAWNKVTSRVDALHGVIFQETEHFISATVRTSNPTQFILLFEHSTWKLGYLINVLVDCYHFSSIGN